MEYCCLQPQGNCSGLWSPIGVPGTLRMLPPMMIRVSKIGWIMCLVTALGDYSPKCFMHRDESKIRINLI